MTAVATTGNTMLIAHDRAQALLADTLRLFVGRGRRWPSCAALAAAAGLSPRAVEGYVAGEQTPGLAALLSLLAVLPPEFADALLAWTELSVIPRHAEAGAHGRLLAECAGLTAGFAAAMADGHIDHRERAMLRTAAAEVVVRLNGFLNQGAGQ